MSGRVDIVFNPNSGRGRAPLLAAEVAEALGLAGFDTRRLTIAQYLGQPIDGGAACIVTVGGDGTVRAIVEGLCNRFAGDGPPIAVLALGTANLVARHLQLPWSDVTRLDTLVRAIAEGRTREMDLPTANGRPFLLMCSAGFDAQVVHELAALRRGPITKLSYVPALAKSWLGFRGDSIEVRADAQLLFGPAPGLVIVANAPEYGTGFTLNPSATSNDGQLDVTVFTMEGRKHIVTTAWHAVTRQVGRAAAIMTTASVVDITGTAPAQIDGEPFGHAPVHVALLPYRQRFIVPA